MNLPWVEGYSENWLYFEHKSQQNLLMNCCVRRKRESKIMALYCNDFFFLIGAHLSYPLWVEGRLSRVAQEA